MSCKEASPKETLTPATFTMNHPIFGNVNLPVRPSTITTKARETKATEPPTPTSLASTKSATSTRSARERTVVRQHPIDREKARRPTNGFRRKAQQGPEIWDAPKIVKEAAWTGWKIPKTSYECDFGDVHRS